MATEILLYVEMNRLVMKLANAKELIEEHRKRLEAVDSTPPLTIEEMLLAMEKARTILQDLAQ